MIDIKNRPEGQTIGQHIAGSIAIDANNGIVFNQELYAKEIDKAINQNQGICSCQKPDEIYIKFCGECGKTMPE